MTAVPLGRPRRLHPRTVAIVVASLALHGVALAPLALNLFGHSSLHVRPQDQAPVNLDITPRPSGLAGPERASLETPEPSEDFSGPSTESRTGPPAPMRPRLSGSPADASSPTAPALIIKDRWQVRPDHSAARIGAALRGSGAGCRILADRLDAAEQARCDRLFAEGAAGAVRIAGTDDPDRDARFAAAGARALADYDRRRAPLKPNSRALPCPHGTDIMGGCPVRVIVPLWSSTDGFLPGLKRDD